MLRINDGVDVILGKDLNQAKELASKIRKLANTLKVSFRSANDLTALPQQVQVGLEYPGGGITSLSSALSALPGYEPGIESKKKEDMTAAPEQNQAPLQPLGEGAREF